MAATQLSCRERLLIVNNLVALSFWHRLIVLPSPKGLVEEIQGTVEFLLVCAALAEIRDTVPGVQSTELGRHCITCKSFQAAHSSETAFQFLACHLHTLKRTGCLKYNTHLSECSMAFMFCSTNNNQQTQVSFSSSAFHLFIHPLHPTHLMQQKKVQD